MAGEIDNREAHVLQRLRTTIVFVVVTGAIVIVLGYIPVTITDLDYRTYVERAGSDELTLFIVAILLPAGWVYRRPRWPQIVVWIMWLSSWGMLFAILAIGSQQYESIGTFWVRDVIELGVIIICTSVVFGMPMIRRTHKSPPLPRAANLPSARVIR